MEQQRFVQFRSHYLFESRFCTPGKAMRKAAWKRAWVMPAATTWSRYPPYPTGKPSMRSC